MGVLILVALLSRVYIGASGSRNRAAKLGLEFESSGDHRTSETWSSRLGMKAVAGV